MLVGLFLVYLVLIWRAIAQVFYSIKHPSRCMSWILVLVFLPVFGLLVYHLLGRSIKKDRFFLVKKPFYNLPTLELQSHQNLLDKLDLAKLLESNKSSAISYDNSVSAHLNGIDVFQQIKEDLLQAKFTIHLDFYIIECGALLNSLHDIFVQKLNEGVEVRLIYDGFGTEDEFTTSFKRFKQIGVQVREFMPYSWLKAYDHVNYRNHRKMIIVDGRISYTGGMNISDKHLNGDAELGVWRDTYVRIVGAASHHMDLVFASDWHHAGGEKISLVKSLKKEHNGSPVQIISSGPDSEYMGILHQYFMMIEAAKETVSISTPYFVPGESLMTALKTKALSGVKVELMMPYTSDSKWMRWIMYSFLEELLSAGVSIWIYHGGFLHNKVVISDTSVCSVGTANFDERSFSTNFEVNAVIYDPLVVKNLRGHFEKDKESCELLAYETFVDRIDRNHFMEALARLTSPLL